MGGISVCWCFIFIRIFHLALTLPRLQIESPPQIENDFPLGIPEEEINVPGEPLNPQDFENALNLEFLLPPNEEGAQDPLELAGLFEGDISGVNVSSLEILEKNVITSSELKWPSAVVPYVISIAYNPHERSIIAAAILEFHRKSCIRFVPRTSQTHYIYLLKGAGCSSSVGRRGGHGGQHVSLGVGCLYKGIVIHELLHALGFWHEQSRPDRDEHVRVLWSNILPGMEHNFQRFSWNLAQSLGVPYDLSSIMHYGMFAFSKNKRSPTLLPQDTNYEATLGQRAGFSEYDLKKLHRLYECRNLVPPEPNTIKCEDHHEHCPLWTSRGECVNNPGWMLRNCAMACQICDVESGGCQDYHGHCGKWATAGECQRNLSYMAVYCPRACRRCPRDVNCRDLNTYCSAWAEQDQCRLNPKYMLQHCAFSCKACGL